MVFFLTFYGSSTEDRKEKIAAALRKDRRHKLKLDLVITPAQLYSVITEGVKKDDLS